MPQGHIEEEDDRETPGKEIRREKCGQRASGSAAVEEDGDGMAARNGADSVPCAALGVTRYKSSSSPNSRAFYPPLGTWMHFLCPFPIPSSSPFLLPSFSFLSP